MLNTSGDVLNLILALCIAILTGFLSIAVYYLISSIKKIHNLVRVIENGVIKIEETATLVKEKIKSGSAYMMIFAEIAKQAIEFAKNNKWSSNNRASKTKTSKNK